MASYDDTATVSGSVVSIENGADEVGAKSCVVTVRPTLSGTSSVSETQTGRNLFDKSAVIDNTWIVVNDTTTESVVGYRTSDYIHVKANTRYYVSTKSSNRTAYYDKNKNGIAYFSFSGGQSFNCLYDGYIRITIKNDIDLDTFIVNEGNAAITYEPYNGTTYTANLGRTIYGGTADIVTGEGQELVKKITVSSFTGTWGAVTNGNAYYISVADTTHSTSVVNPIMMQANQLFTYGSVGRNSAPTWQYGGNDGGPTVHTFILPSEYDTLTKANNFLASLQTPLEVTLTLATPTDFTFTGQEIPTRLGYNAFWSEQGDTELTYYKDGYGTTSVTIHKETPDGEPIEETRKLHRIIYEGQVDVINGTGLIYRGESGTQYDPPEQISFTPIEVSTDEGENTLYADQGDSAITYRKSVD